jgi:hypothetical protein
MKRLGILGLGAIAVIIVMVSACKKSGESASDIETPPIEKGCLSGQCVEGQFETAYQRFVIITGNVVNLRARPDVTSRVIVQLPVTRKVTALYAQPGEKTIGGMKGRWVFVRDAASIGTQGWVFDHFVGYTDRFTKPERWVIREIRVILGGRLMVYKCTTGGRFETVQNEMLYKKDGKKIAGKASGEILQCKNVIWLKKETPDDHPVFFSILSDGKLALPDQFKDSRGIVMIK